MFESSSHNRCQLNSVQDLYLINKCNLGEFPKVLWFLLCIHVWRGWAFARLGSHKPTALSGSALGFAFSMFNLMYLIYIFIGPHKDCLICYWLVVRPRNFDTKFQYRFGCNSLKCYWNFDRYKSIPFSLFSYYFPTRKKTDYNSWRTLGVGWKREGYQI